MHIEPPYHVLDFVIAVIFPISYNNRARLIYYSAELGLNLQYLKWNMKNINAALACDLDVR